MADNNQTREELEEMDEEELKNLAASRGITVRASDGSDNPSVDDYVEALAPPDELPSGEPATDPDIAAGDEKAKRAQAAAGKPASRIDETVPGGRYVNPQGKTVNAEGKEVDGDGKPIKEEDKKYPDSPE